MANVYLLTYPRKNTNWGVVRTWKFHGYGRESIWKFQGSIKIKKEVKVSRGDQEKIMWNFHGSWFLAMELPRGVT